MIHDIGQDGYLQPGETGEQDRSFDVVRVKYIDLYNVKSVVFFKLESSMSQTNPQSIKFDMGANGNLMSLNSFKTLL